MSLVSSLLPDGASSSSVGSTTEALASDYTLTTTEADIGLSVTVPTAGTYIVIASIDWDIATGDTFVSARLNVNGSNYGGSLWGKRSGAHAATTTSSRQWRITTTGANEVVKLRASKTGTGTSKIWSTHTELSVIGPAAALT